MSRNIEQKNIEAEAHESDQWEKDDLSDDAEVIKLSVGGNIEGVLIDKFQSVKYDTSVYKIKTKDEDTPKIMLGTIILDKMMKNKEIGEEIRIVRLQDTFNRKGQHVQNWETYHKKKDVKP